MSWERVWVQRRELEQEERGEVFLKYFLTKNIPVLLSENILTMRFPHSY